MINQHYCCMIFYNDGPDMLEKSIMAAKNLGLRIITIDGAFQEFMKFGQVNQPYSTDGCFEVAKGLSDLCIESPSDGWADQMTKRNRYIKEIPANSYFWAIDADEVLSSVPINFNHITEPVYRIIEHRMLTSNTDPVVKDNVRVFKRDCNIGYKYQHSRMYDLDIHMDGDMDSGLIVQSSQFQTHHRFPQIHDINGDPVTIKHYQYARNSERLRQKQNFYRMRQENYFNW